MEVDKTKVNSVIHLEVVSQCRQRVAAPKPPDDTELKQVACKLFGLLPEQITRFTLENGARPDLEKLKDEATILVHLLHGLEPPSQLPDHGLQSFGLREWSAGQDWQLIIHDVFLGIVVPQHLRAQLLVPPAACGLPNNTRLRTNAIFCTSEGVLFENGVRTLLMDHWKPVLEVPYPTGKSRWYDRELRQLNRVWLPSENVDFCTTPDYQIYFIARGGRPSHSDSRQKDEAFYLQAFIVCKHDILQRCEDRWKRLVNTKRLPLIFDLDETLICRRECGAKKRESSDEEFKAWMNVSYFIKVGKEDCRFTIRTGARELLLDVARGYEVSVCTAGADFYAKAVIQLCHENDWRPRSYVHVPLSEDQRRFWYELLPAKRIASVHNQKMLFGENNMKKSLKVLYPFLQPDESIHRISIIVDDRQDIWLTEFQANVYWIQPYNESTSQGSRLFMLVKILRGIHERFFQQRPNAVGDWAQRTAPSDVRRYIKDVSRPA